MLTFLTNAFGMSNPQTYKVGATRTANLSGNILSFAMPEDFSKDLPAEPMRQTLDIEDNVTDTPIITRWWDIKKPGFFGSNLGTVMMNISVLKTPENHLKKIHGGPYEITNRLDLIFLIDESLHSRYKNKHPSLYDFAGTVQLFGNEISTPYRDNIFNEQKWTSYSVSGPDNQLIVNHVIPLSRQAYIEVSFNYSPNTGVPPRTFRDFAYKITEKVESSLFIEYTPNNAVKKAVEEDWLKTTNEDVVKMNRGLIISRIFGPEHLQQTLDEDKQRDGSI